MEQETQSPQPIEASNERAVAWARQMMARKRATQQRMQEEYDKNYELQALVAELFQRNKQQKVNDKL